MILYLIKHLKNYKKLRDSLIYNKYLIQTSNKKDLLSKKIKINNYIMIKEISDFWDFRPSYIDKFKSNNNILVNYLDNLFKDYVVENDYLKSYNYDIVINDYSTEIYIKEIIRDLIIIDYNDKALLIYLNNINSLNIEELGSFIINETDKFVIFDFKLLYVYDIEELQSFFNLNYRKTNKLRILNKFINLFKEKIKEKNQTLEKEFTNIFLIDNVNKLNEFDFKNYIYLSKDLKLKIKDTYNIASLGITGSGKTFSLINLVIQLLIGFNFHRIIFFDTQNTFINFSKKINPIYRNHLNNLKDFYFYVNEDNFYLNEVDFINSVNYILESSGYLDEYQKKQVLKTHYDDKEQFIKDINKIVEYEEKKLDLKNLSRIEDLKEVQKFINKVKIKSTSIFEDLENNNKFFVIFNFKNNMFYSISTFLYFRKLYDFLYTHKENDYTYMILDETQKYLESEFLKKVLLKLVKEKRQYGFKLFYTGLSYVDIKDLVKFTHYFIFNSFNDIYLLNNLKNSVSFNIENLKTPKEKILFNAVDNKINKYETDLNLIN